MALCACGDPTPAPAPLPGDFDHPQAVRFAGGLLVVSNSGYDLHEWRPGSLSVLALDPPRIVNRIPTAWPNPTRLEVVGEELWVVSTGALDLSDPRHPSADEGGLERLPLSRLAGAGAGIARTPVELPGPADLATTGDVTLLTSAIQGAVSLVTPDGERLVRYHDGVGLGSVARWGGRFLVADFNTDRLHVVEADGRLWGCSVDLGESAADLEGAQSLAVMDGRLYALMALSGAIRGLDLEGLVDGPSCGAPRVETVAAPLGPVPNELRAHGGLLYVVDSADQRVTAWDPATGEATGRWVLPPGSSPWAVDFSPDGRWMAVTEWAAHAVRLFDLRVPGDPGVRVGGEPDELAPPPAPRTDGVALADEVVAAPTGPGPFRDPRRAVNGVRGAGDGAGSTDVFSLGLDESLVLRWSGRVVVDGPGPDLAVFENPFRYGADGWFLDPVEVAVSRDGALFVPFPVDYRAVNEALYEDDPASWSGFAGLTPVWLHEEANPLDPFDPGAGGDRFDLADLPGEEGDAIRAEGFRYLRLRVPAPNPDTGAPYPRDPVSNGPDIDGVYARRTVTEPG